MGYLFAIDDRVQDIYASLNWAGAFLLAVLILTLTLSSSARLRRDPTLINAFAVIIAVNVLNTIYWMSNGGTSGYLDPETLPNREVCRAQAALVAGSQPAQAAAVFALCARVGPGTKMCIRC